MKTVNALLLAMGLTSGFSAQAHTENQDLCYPLAHGENGLGSRNSMFLPSFFTQSQSWSAAIFVTNTSYKSINVQFEFLKYDASPYAPYDVTFRGEFNNDNYPLNSEIAILKPFQTGVITIHDNNNDNNKGFTGKVKWQTDSCLDKAIKVDIRNSYFTNSRFDQGFITLNGGNPF